MTEQEWLVWADPTPMLEFLRGKASDRKLRLFACACCRLIVHLLTDEAGIRAIDNAEKYADRLTSKAVLRRSRQTVTMAETGARQRFKWDDQWKHWTSRAIYLAATEKNFFGVHSIVQTAAAWKCEQLRTSVRGSSITLIHCIFGNPFRPLTTDPSWLTSTVVSLATSIYDERAFDRLPIVADALEDAGCDNADILNHCRQPGVHVRGCWPVDLLLGKP